MCEGIEAALRDGKTVIIDYVITSFRIWQALCNAVSESQKKTVLVSCDVETLRRREAERGDRCAGSAEASLQYLYPKTGYDLCVDSSGKRSVHRFVSGDILAYQSKDLGTYYLDFSRVGKDSDVYRYINEPIYTGSLGESYSILNTIRQDTVRIYCEPDYLYDSMVFVYECTPLNLLAK